MKAYLVPLVLWLLLGNGGAQEPTPDIVEISEIFEKEYHLEVEKPGIVFATRKGGRQRGSLKVGSHAELIRMTDRAYYVSGKLSSGLGVFGWVSPAAFKFKQPETSGYLKSLYDRRLLVRELIAANEIAIGMTVDEVREVMGRPTSTSVKQNADGQEDILKYIDYEERKHYVTGRDPYTGGLFRRYSHTTTEIKSQSTFTFQDGYLTESEMSETRARRSPKILSRPLILGF